MKKRINKSKVAFLLQVARDQQQELEKGGYFPTNGQTAETMKELIDLVENRVFGTVHSS